MEVSLLNATVLFQVPIFAALIFLSWKFIWPPLMDALEKRNQRIAEGLSAKDHAQAALAQVSDQVDAIIRDARRQAGDIIASAQAQAAIIVGEASDSARAEAQAALREALVELESAQMKAAQELQRDFPELVGVACGKVLGRPVEMSRHKEITDKLASSL